MKVSAKLVFVVFAIFIFLGFAHATKAEAIPGFIKPISNKFYPSQVLILDTASSTGEWRYPERAIVEYKNGEKITEENSAKYSVVSAVVVTENNQTGGGGKTGEVVVEEPAVPEVQEPDTTEEVGDTAEKEDVLIPMVEEAAVIGEDVVQEAVVEETQTESPAPEEQIEEVSEGVSSVIQKIFSSIVSVIFLIPQQITADEVGPSATKEQISSPYIEFFDFGLSQGDFDKFYLNLDLKSSEYEGKVNIYVSYDKDHYVWENIASLDSLNNANTTYSFALKDEIGLEYFSVRVEYQGERIEALLIGDVHVEGQNEVVSVLDFFQSENLDEENELNVKLDDTEEILLTSTLFKMGFPKDLNGSIVLSTDEGSSNTLSMKFVGASASSTINRVGNSILYTNVFENTNVEYKVEENNLKEYIHLLSDQSPEVFVYAANLNDFDVVKSDQRTIKLYKKGNGGDALYELYTITAPIMYDASGNNSDSIEMQVDGEFITLVPDKEWLSSAIYPIVIDPTVEIKVLNLHSQPAKDEHWNVNFTTVGVADLTITPADQATIDDDEFTSLFCGDEDRTSGVQILSGDVLFYPNWECSEVATVSHLTLRAGSHHLLFQFGDAQAEAFNASYTWDGGGGDAQWTTAANWSSDIVPNSGDTVTFDNTCVSNCNPIIATTTAVATMNIASTYAGTITQGDGYTFTVTTSFTQSGGTFVGGMSTTTFRNAFTISGGTFTAASTTVFGFNSGSPRTINVNTTQTFEKVEFNSSVGNYTWQISSGDTLVVTRDLILTDGGLSTGTIDARGNIYQGSAFDGGTAVLDFGDNSVNQTYYANSGVGVLIRLDSASDASDTILFNAESTLYGVSTTASFSGTIPISNPSNYNVNIGTSGWYQAAGTFTQGPWEFGVINYPNGNSVFSLSGGTFTGSTATTTFTGDFTISGGTFTAASTTVFENSAAGRTININSTQTFEKLEFDDSVGYTRTITSGDTLIVTRDLYLTNGGLSTGTIDARGNIYQGSAFDGGTAVLDFGDNAVNQTYSLSGGIGVNLRLDSASDASDSIVFNAASTLYGVSTTASFSGTIPISNSGNYDISIRNSGWYQAAGTFNLGNANFATLFVSGNTDSPFVLSGGTFNGGTATTTFPGSFTVSGGTYNAASTTVFSIASGPRTINVNVSQNFHHITFSDSVYTRTISSGDTVTALGNILISAGTVSTGSLESYGDVRIQSFSTSPITFLGTATQNFNLTGATGSFNADITINKSGGEVQLASTLTMDAASQDLVIQEGTLNINGNALAVNGTSGTLVVQDGGVLKLNGDETITTNSNNPQLQSGSTIEYAGSGSYTPKGYSYSNISISGSGSFSATSGPFYIGNNFTQSAGTFTASAGTTTIAGDITRTGGTFTHNSGVVELNGTTQAINDSTTFNDLYKVVSSADTLTFEAGATTTIAGTMTLRGSSGNVLTLQGSAGSIPWYVDPQSTRSIQYLDVNDSYNSNSMAISAAGTNSTDGGGNTNWIFETNAPTAGTVVVSDTQLDSITINISGASDDTALATLPYVFRNVTTDYYFLATSSTFATSTGLSSGTSYTFEVGVYDIYGNSATTTSVSGSTLSPSSSGDGSSSGGSSGSSSGNGRGGVAELFSLFINDNNFYTNTSNVKLSLGYPASSNVYGILLARSSDFFDPVMITPATTSEWVLCGFDSCPNGEYFVFAKYLDNKNKTLGTASDSIFLQTITDQPSPVVASSTNNNPSQNSGGGTSGGSSSGGSGGGQQGLDINASISVNKGKLSSIVYGSILSDFRIQINTVSSIRGRVKYEIDWNGDGTFDYSFLSNSKKINTPVHNFESPGDYSIKVKASISGYEDETTVRAIVEQPQFNSIISGSVDRKNWTNNLSVPVKSRVSFLIETFGNVNGWYSYYISCDSSQTVSRQYKNTTRTTYLARNTCLYTKDGVYTVTLVATNGSLTATSQMQVVVGSGLTIPPPPVSTTTPEVTPTPPTDPGTTSTTTTPATQTTDTTTPSLDDPVPGVESGESLSDRIIADVATPFIDRTSFIAASIFADMSENRIFNNLVSLLAQALSILAIIAYLIKDLVDLIRLNPTAASIISGVVVLPLLTLLRNTLSPFGIRSLFDLYAGIISVVNNFLTWSHLRAKRRYWGMVYDSENKQPIDPAIVTLTDINSGKVVETAVTDLYGRYGFMNYIGQFKIDAKKTHYSFPSTKVTGNSDGIFNNIYHGETINIEKMDDLITPSIPMDRMFYDWNQEFKTVHINPRLDYLLSYIFRVLSWIFTTIVIYLFVSNPTFVTFISVLFTLVTIVISRIIPEGKLWGTIRDATKRELSIVLYYEGLSNVVVSHAIISENGRYFLKTLPGEYILSVRDKKSGLEIYKTGVKVGKIGVVNEDINIQDAT